MTMSLDKAEINILKTIRSQKPMSEKEAKEYIKAREEHKKWIESMQKNYPGICFTRISVDGVTVYYNEEWW